MLKLYSNSTAEDRLRLAQKLAPCSHSPSDLVLRIAKDEVRVAMPVLADSPLLSQEDLLDLIEQVGETHMVLYRFNDVVAELPDTVGMQVHRSHWIAFAAVENLARDGGRLWIIVRDGSKVPVSRKYTEPVQARFGKLEADAKRAVN